MFHICTTQNLAFIHIIIFLGNFIESFHLYFYNCANN